MKKVAILLIALLVLPVFAADPGDFVVKIRGKRLIVEKSSAIELQQKNCQVKHELKDSIAVECPGGVSVNNARESRIFRIIDLQADTQIGADKVWAEGIDGSGVTVVVLDTGVQGNHAELADSIVGCQSFVSGEDCTDYNGHGTHVTGIITANGIKLVSGGGNATGAAPGANVYMLKVCNKNGECFEDDMMAAMEFAVNNSLGKIMSISIGGGNFGSHCDFDPLAAKVNWVVDNGVLVSIASGNDGKGVSSPACASKAVAVGAVDKNNVVPWWSNRGSALDIVAPGVNILSTYSCQAANDCSKTWYAYLSGTSMSAPHIAGTAALLLQTNPSATIDEMKAAMYSTAKPVSKCYRCSLFSGSGCIFQSTVTCNSDIVGAGVVDAYNAYLAIKPPTTTTSTTTTTTSTTTSSTTSSTATTTTTEPTTSTTTTTTEPTTTSTTIPEETTTSTTTTTTLPIPSILFSDSFESGLGNWVQDTQRDWRTSTQRKTDGLRSAEVDGFTSDGTLTTVSVIDLSSKTTATLTFSWFIESSWDSNEYICLDIFSNGAWSNGVPGSSRCLDGNLDSENTWHNENIDLSNYLTSDFKLRFRARVSSSNEDGDVDNVIVSAV